MYPLGKSEAVMFVRKNLDEQLQNDSDMIDVDDIDSNEFENLVAQNLPEAINAVHSYMPLPLLDGEHLTPEELATAQCEEGVISFATHTAILRLVAFKATGCAYTVTEPVAEYSAEGRMQLNPYARGTHDRPRLVMLQGKDKDKGTEFRFYSCDTTSPGAGAIERFEYIPRYRYSDTVSTYNVADNVIENVIDYLTGMMLVTYNNNDKANYFFAKAGVPIASSNK